MYIHLGDEKYCCYVPRETGDTFSLLVEIVENNKNINLFRQSLLDFNTKINSYEDKKVADFDQYSFELKVGDDSMQQLQKSTPTKQDKKQPILLKRAQIRLSDNPTE